MVSLHVVWCKYDDPPFVIVAAPSNVKENSKVFINYFRAFLMAAKLYKTDFDEYIRAYHQFKISKGKKVEIDVLKNSLKNLQMHPQIDERFYAYVEKMNKVLKEDGKVTKIVDFRSGTGIDFSAMKAAIEAENYQ